MICPVSAKFFLNISQIKFRVGVEACIRQPLNKLSFNFYDENLPIALTKKKNKYNLYSIADFRKFLYQNDSVKFHQEGHTLSGRLPDCDRFIGVTH